MKMRATRDPHPSLWTVAALALLAGLTACSTSSSGGGYVGYTVAGDALAGSNADGSSWLACKCDAPADAGSGSEDTGATGEDTGELGDGCDDRARLVYVLSDSNDLLQFMPDKLTFKLVGKLNCVVPGGSPFSMSVDRQATAWVLYQKLGGGGGLFEVSTLDATCKPTNYSNGQLGFDLFGMGFSANSKGSKQETLFIAGGKSSSWNKLNGNLGTIGIPGLGVTYKGKIDVPGGSPELTGDGDGKLWGFFPASSPPSVREIDKVTGKTGKTFTIPAGSMSNVQAWAFARWGGSFYLFFKAQFDSSSAVFKIDPTGAVSKVIAKTGYNIVGAGVSSCAPTSALSGGP